MKLGAFLEKLAKKSGIDTTTADFAAILAFDMEIPDVIATKLDTSLLTIEAAKNNSEIARHHKATVLNAADAKMLEMAEELGLELGDDFTGSKNSFDKLAMITRLANAAGKKAAGAGNKSTAEEWVKKEADLQKLLKEQKESMAAAELAFNNTREEDLTTFQLEKFLLGKAADFALPGDMDMDIKTSLALSTIKKDLQTKGLTVKRDATGQLTILDKEGKPAYNNAHEAIEPNTYLNGVLTQNKLLKVNDPNNPPAPAPAGGGAPSHLQNRGGQTNTAIVNELDNQLKSM